MRNQKLSLLAVVSACLLALFGCAPSGGSSSSEETVADPLADLQGNWSTSCQPRTGVYELWTYKVTGTDAVQEFGLYQDSDCSTPLGKRKETYSGIAVGDNVTVLFEGTSLEPASGYRFTAMATGATATVHVADLLNEFQNENVCEMNWELDVPNDVSGKTCSSTSIGTTNFLPKDQTGYNNFTIVNNKLYVGYPRFDGTYSDSVSGWSYTKQ